jgi:type I restriction enzyme M protein
MLAVLKSDGRMATVMPHGVLFRGGEEREARRHFVDKGYLDAVIGLPPSLFYGTGIPACILVISKEGARERNDVLFVNADREYREGKAQNHLRPEDIAKIVDVYRRRETVPAYARLVPKAEIAAEEYNCNIRRYVDNAPPPEPHDVRAHIHGGVPTREIDALGCYWINYPGLPERLFVPRPTDTIYGDFAPAIAERRAIAPLVREDPGLVQAHEAFLAALDAWWTDNAPLVLALAPEDGGQGNVYALRRALIADIAERFAGSTLLNPFQVRGAMARYVDDLKADFKSIAASGWGAELIPADEILTSQFPELMAENEAKEARLEELRGLFAAADVEDFEDEDETGVLPGEEVARLKEALKDARATLKMLTRDAKAASQNLWTALKGAGVAKTDMTLRGTLTEPDLDSARLIIATAERHRADDLFVDPVRRLVEEGEPALATIASAEAKLERHAALEEEAKRLKAELRQAEKTKDELVAKARAAITTEAARDVLMARFHNLLVAAYRRYLDTDRRACIAAVENLHDKYATTLRQIETVRTAATRELEAHMEALGYV